MTLDFNPIGYVAIATIGILCLIAGIAITKRAAATDIPDIVGVVLCAVLVVGPVVGTLYGEDAWYHARHPMTGCVKQRLWDLLEDDRGTPVPVVTADQWRWNCPDR